jgi:CDP-diacylglycerol--glycerol-3-phosphate 3-phosphatidyltransferase
MITKNKNIFNLSNAFSALRLLLVIPIWILMNNLASEQARYTVVGLCIFAAITDVLDGYFARKMNQVTEFGKIVDPLADKVIVGAVVLKLFLLGELSAYYFTLIIGRDLLILLGGIIVSKKIGKVLPSNVLGKITVILISLVLLLMLLQVSHETIVFKGFYYSSILLIFMSLVAYAVRAIEFLRKSENGSVRKLQF